MIMSNAGTDKDEPLGTDEVDTEALAAAQALIDLSRMHLRSRDSPSCICADLRRTSQITLEADNYPETEAEDWQAMGRESLRMRVSGAYTKAGLQIKPTADNEKKLALLEKVLDTSGFEPKSKRIYQSQRLCVGETMKQEDKAEINLGAGFRRGKNPRLAKLQSKPEE